MTDKMKQDHKNFKKYGKNYNPTSQLSPNVDMIRGDGIRVILNKIPRAVRKELMEGVRNGQIGHIRKDDPNGVPEIFFHPNSWKTAIERISIEQEYTKKCVKSIRIS